jgi:hypothetical protein
MKKFTNNSNLEYYHQAIHNAQLSNMIASRINALKDVLKQWGIKLNQMDEAVHPVLAFITFVLLGVTIWAEYVFSKDLYIDLMPQYPYVPVIILVFAGLIVSELLKYQVPKLKALQEAVFRENHKDDIALQTQTGLEKEQRIYKYCGYILLVFFSIFILTISYQRVRAMLDARVRIDIFGIFDLLPLFAFWLEIFFGLFAIHAVRRLLLGCRNYFLKRKISKKLNACSHHTEMSLQYWEACAEIKRPNEELLISLHRYEHKTLGQDDYTDLSLSHIKLELVDEQNRPINNANVNAITDDNHAATVITLQKEGAIILNWEGSSSKLSSLIVNGQVINGSFVKGGTYKVKCISNRQYPKPIGF